MKFWLGFLIGFVVGLTSRAWWPWAERAVGWLVNQARK